MKENLKVAVYQQKLQKYSENPPFNPPCVFPETPFNSPIDEQNEVYSSVRELFKLLKYDAENYGKPMWNPLGWLINPGETVFLKPNMIAEGHYYKRDEWNYVISNGSVIRAAVDYVFIALKGKGKIIIGDSPSTESDFEKMCGRMGLREICKLYAEEKNFEIEIFDLRDEHWIERDRVVIDKIKLAGDPRGKVEFNLSDKSMFAELDDKNIRYYGAFYDSDETNIHHQKGRHEYKIAKSVIEADVLINLPKLKTHKKCGLTVNLKSLVGINAQKNWLPHYIFGSPENGGDQFEQENTKQKLENALVGKAKKALLQKNPVTQAFARKTKNLAYRFFGHTEEVVRSGNWHGNNTVWRMSLDLNRILFYGKPDGSFSTGGKVKRFFSIVDGIIAMEGNGPVAGDAKPLGILIAGENPAAVDAVCANIMGFDIEKIPLIKKAFEKHELPLIRAKIEDIETISNLDNLNKKLSQWNSTDNFQFKPHFGWIGFIEKED
ncbi:MAG: DUF362 domain-containing protein [Pyrinomonadaceae bacterium]